LARRPSLFRRAPSELAQDAFLAWLIEWSDPACEAADRHLHRVGRAFVEALFAAAEPRVSELGAVRSVDIKRQHEGVDILVVINGDRALILEDKVHAGEHGDQLRRYVQTFTIGPKRYEAGVHAVYVKTGGPTSANDLLSKGFGYLARPTILAVIRDGIASGATNDILTDFATHLAELDVAFDAWRRIPPLSWSFNDRLWESVFHELLASVPALGWSWLPNRAGGQYGLWFAGTEVEPGVSIYVQADSRGRLHVRLSTQSTTTAERRAQRDRWSNYLICREGAATWIRPPSRSAVGRTMAIADFIVPWLHATADGGGDIKAIAATLRRCAEWLVEGTRSPVSR
jgi:hypothetical protein